MIAGHLDAMNIKGIEALIFDLGGTLYEPASDICGLTRQFMVDVGVDESIGLSDDHIKEALIDANNWLWTYMIKNNVPVHWEPGTNEWVQYDIVLLKGLGITEEAESLAEHYQVRWDKFFEEVKPVLIEGVRETLHELKRKDFALGVASNRYGNPKQTLQADSIYDLFGSIEFTGVPGYTKPSPYMLLRVAEELGVNPRKCAYVGNIVEYDCVAAQRAEMIPILLTWVDPHEFDKITTDVIVISHIADLLEILT
ncbi:HAD family hydrolase [Candidatus Thorarchaeota archaeon]|nr:MAG: HAD family hydrolase [Candidatus Thorarchaeota archaeon]